MSFTSPSSSPSMWTSLVAESHDEETLRRRAEENRSRITPAERRRRKMHALARRANFRRAGMQSMLPAAKLRLQALAFDKNVDLKRYEYENDPESRRRKREEYRRRMDIMAVRLPRLMDKIHQQRMRRIWEAAIEIRDAWFGTLRARARQAKSVRLMLGLRNERTKRRTLRTWNKNAYYSKVLRVASQRIWRRIVGSHMKHWRATAKKQRRKRRYAYAIHKKKWNKVRLLKHWQSWVILFLQRKIMRASIRSMQLRNSGLPAFRKWYAFYQQRKRVKEFMTRQLGSMKLFCLREWHDYTVFMITGRTRILRKIAFRVQRDFTELERLLRATDRGENHPEALLEGLSAALQRRS